VIEVAVVHHMLGPFHITRTRALERIEGRAGRWVHLASEERLFREGGAKPCSGR